MASWMSPFSVLASQMAYQSDRVSLSAIETEWRRKIDLRERRMAEGLAGFAGPQVEVKFADLDHDWRNEIRCLYGALRLELTPAALDAMERQQAAAIASPQRLHSRTYRGFARA